MARGAAFGTIWANLSALKPTYATPSRMLGLVAVMGSSENGSVAIAHAPARDWFFTNYYSISPGMVSKIPLNKSQAE